jgi:uncharacterized protein (DUF58 family)
MRLLHPLRAKLDRLLRRRQGPDGGRVTLHRRRIYILPTRLGLVFAAMLLGMLLGSLNYANNLGLALTFVLASLGLVAMHACHRNLQGLAITGAGTEPPYAGQGAGFRFGLANPSLAPRIDIETGVRGAPPRIVTVPAEDTARLTVELPTRRRGRLRLTRLEVATRYPFGLFRAWSVLHPDLDCLVYPAPAPAGRAPAPPAEPGPSGHQDAARGEDDFAGLKDYHPGDPPRRIAWKAHARGGELLVKEFAGAAAPARVFDLESVPGRELEERLGILARWIDDAHGRGEAFGLRLPGIEVPVGAGESQHRRCLAALAVFGDPEPDHA